MAKTKTKKTVKTAKKPAAKKAAKAVAKKKSVRIPDGADATTVLWAILHNPTFSATFDRTTCVAAETALNEMVDAVRERDHLKAQLAKPLIEDPTPVDEGAPADEIEEVEAEEADDLDDEDLDERAVDQEIADNQAGDLEEEDEDNVVHDEDSAA